MKQRIFTLFLLCLPFLMYAQNYEQQGDELFAQEQYEKAVKKYSAAEVVADMNGQAIPKQLREKKDKALKCIDLLGKATYAEENSQFEEAETLFLGIYELHAIPKYKQRASKCRRMLQAEQARIAKEKELQIRKEAGIIIISKGTTRINDNEYKDRQDIRSVIIPEGVLEIGEHAFDGCYNLTHVEIPNGVLGICKFAFRGCKFTSVTLPSSLINIGPGAFDFCNKLESITIPSKVDWIGNYAFSGCQNLKSITFLGYKPPRCGNGVFEMISTGIPVYVPASSISAYNKLNSLKYFRNVQAIK